MANMYLNDSKQLNQQQEQVFYNIVANLESHKVQPFCLAKIVADNWNLFHNTSYLFFNYSSFFFFLGGGGGQKGLGGGCL